ncbi:hypothetical protein [Bradyrhizobium sp. AUGA SZCCT0182]|uniref:hypothetical protein n=1 Tax=Bradyrhizobium sp. AUGA SZCCT0182 TaxID=2807667 RepID=UPI001BA56181|nr:hypothetical protein [Bradyrhizobium sp. AUGA SZCCT0182]MBR1231634.1 hypothetical protein [Bradyrhizobium sp. AUGA SZCCT0182]
MRKKARSTTSPIPNHLGYSFPKKHHWAIEALEHSFKQLDRRNPVEVNAAEDMKALARLSG